MTNYLGTADDLRRSFLEFMQSRGSKIIPSASLLPENDPTTLFTGSGMQPMIPYLLGEKHPSGNDVTDVQKCIRTVDIDIVGDTSHLTFFEMTGRWVFGADPQNYRQTKRDQITAMWEWQIGQLGLDPQRFYVSVYQGNPSIGVPVDSDAVEVWEELFRAAGVEPIVEAEPWKYGVSRGGRIFLYDEGENWWSRAGRPEKMPVGEPGGPDSEMFFDFDPVGDPQDHPATDTPRFMEIGNNVFMSLRRTAEGFEALERPNIDYGGGLERIATAITGNPDIYRTVFFREPIAKLEQMSGRSYSEKIREFRIILDHARAGTFLINDGAPPSNSEAGYITRRLLRRAIRIGRNLDLPTGFLTQISEIFIEEAKAYPELADRKTDILAVVLAEEHQFQKTLAGGEREIRRCLNQKGAVTGADAFHLYETYGFPLELTEEFLKENGAEMLDAEAFQAAAKQHADMSRTAAAGKFKGGLADHSEKTTALHTATHLMLAGLRQILGDHVYQKGSNITAERARFDFSHPERVSDEQKRAVEKYVNDAIAAHAPMVVVEIPKQQAKADGVVGSFWEKYPENVKVYEFKDASGRIWSKELCGGPHVENTYDLATFGTFSIQKEESVSAGVRRVKVVLE
jgi:alanyl-tRNA synthetase